MIIYIYRGHLIVLCCCFFVWCIPQQNSQRQFWSSVLLMSVRQSDMSPSGNTCLVGCWILRLDLWILEQLAIFPVSHVGQVSAATTGRRDWLHLFLLTVFNSVIRLIKLKQLAIFRVSHVRRVSVATASRCDWLQLLLCMKVQAMLLGVVFTIFLFMAFGEAQVRMNSRVDHLSRPEGCDSKLEGLGAWSRNFAWMHLFVN